jgi:hypothetical protein
MPGPFTEVDAPDARNVADAWAGWDGLGLGALKSLYVTTGARPEGGHGVSQIWRIDEGGTWENDDCAEGAEVINKIRNDAEAIYAFFESPGEGQTWIVRKSLDHDGAGGWEFLSAPTPGESGTVGGRGIGIDPAGEGEIFFGASHDWAGEQIGAVYSGTDFEEARTHTPSLMWELEYDSEGRLWEFWSSFGDENKFSGLYVDGEEKTAPPGGDISHAAWFGEHMYVTGNLASEEGAGRTTVSRSTNGDEWETVYEFEEATVGDHVLYVPRQTESENGELWAVGQQPLEVAWTLDGAEGTWTREESIPAFDTNADTNHLTAIAYWLDGVWVLARDADANAVRTFTDGTGGSLMIQVI